MIDVRRAGPDDADELMVLRGVMISALWGRPSPGASSPGAPAPGVPAPDGWMATGAALLRTHLISGVEARMAAFVVDRDDRQGIAACAVGQIDQRLPGPGDPTGRRGYVYNVATHAEYRRRGYSRACMESLLRWFEESGVGVVDLRASGDGEPLYTSLGFRRTDHPTMRRTSQR
jgi:ribosomal protein S18 acetylase RimI-like enzyme